MKNSTCRNNKGYRMFAATSILTLLVCSSAVVGQSEEGERQDDHVVVGSVDFHVGGNSMARFVTSELSLYRDVVKNAPYSAEAVTETTQTLADGNQIYREMTAVLYRDSEGRTRREQTLTGYIPWASTTQGQAFQVIVINDPVAGVSYSLDPATRTAVAHAMSNFKSLPMQDVRQGTSGIYFFSSTGDMTSSGTMPAAQFQRGGPGETEGDMTSSGKMSNQYLRGGPGETEVLGTRSIEGVVAEGTRSTISIPAGSIGNERPIEVVSERLYSSELQTLVMSRHSDPRFGETVYQLKNISLAEPSSDLFEVPLDYDIAELSTILEQLR